MKKVGHILAELFADLFQQYRNTEMWDGPDMDRWQVEIRNGYFDDDPDLWGSERALRGWLLGYMTGLPSDDRAPTEVESKALCAIFRRWWSLYEQEPTTCDR